MRTVYHHDGHVTLWDVFRQEWKRTSRPSNRTLNALPPAERDRVIRHTGCRLRIGDPVIVRGGRKGVVRDVDDTIIHVGIGDTEVRVPARTLSIPKPENYEAQN